MRKRMTKKNRKLAAALLAAALMLGSCGNSGAGGTGESGSSENRSSENSSSENSSSENSSSESAAESSTSDSSESENQEAKLPDDGKLRILSDWDNNRSIVFCGNKKVEEGEGCAFTPNGAEDGKYYALRTVDPEAKDGEGGYHTALYDSDGKLLIDELNDALTVCGNWLFSYDDGFAASDQVTQNVYDLRTMEPVDVQAGYAMQTGDYIAVNVSDATGLSSAHSGTVVYRADDLSEVRFFKGYACASDPMIPGIFILNRYNEESQELDYLAYNPETGEEYPGVESSCGWGYMLQRTDDGYNVLDTSGTVIESTDRRYNWYSDKVKTWIDESGEYYTSYIDAPFYSGAKSIDYITIPIEDATNNKSTIFVAYGSSGDLISTDGELLLSVHADDYGYEAGRVNQVRDDILSISPKDWGEPGLTLLYKDGHTVDFEKYSYVSPLYGSEYLSASYMVGNTYLTDILDQDGNVLLEGLKNVSTVEGGLISCEKGFYKGLMDTEGNWLYKESIFDTAEDETGEYW